MDIITLIIAILFVFGGLTFYLFILFGGEDGRALTPNEVMDLLDFIFHKNNKPKE